MMHSFKFNYDTEEISGPEIFIKQGEHNVTEIFIDELEYDFTEGNYFLDFRLAAGTKCRIALTVDNWDEYGTLFFKLPQSITSRAGVVSFELLFYGDDTIKVFNTIHINVVESINAELA